MRILIAVAGVALLGSGVALAQGGSDLCRVQDFGAKGDGVTNDTVAIQKAIDHCAAIDALVPGSRVVVLGGAAMFVSGPLDLKSHITLEVEKGTTLAGSENHADYPAMEQFGEHGLKPLLMAKDAQDVTIRGGGVIDGRGQSWWPNRAPGYLRPRLIVFDHCKHVLMENITVQNSPMWQIVPYYSEDLTFRNMQVLAPEPAGHNTDGIDPFSSKDVVIEHVLIDTGDDNVAIKSGEPGSAGPDAPSEDIIVQDCVFLHGHGLSVGSEVSGGVKDLRVERVVFKGTTAGIRIKSGRDRGSDIGNFIYKNITMTDVATPIQITDYYGVAKGTSAANVGSAAVTRLTPHMHDITIENLVATGAKTAMDIEGLPEAPVMGVTMKNVVISAQKGAKIFYAEVAGKNVVVKAASGVAVTTGAGAKVSWK